MNRSIVTASLRRDSATPCDCFELVSALYRVMEKQETVSIKKYIIGIFKPWLFQVQGYAVSEMLGCDAQFGFNRCRRYMGRRNKDKELVEILLVLPWWVNIGLGIAGYFGLRWFFPSMLPPLMKGMVPAIQSIAWIPLLLFSFFGLLSFSRARSSTRVSSAAHTRRSQTTERPTEILVGRPAGKLGHAWGNHVVVLAEPGHGAQASERWSIEALRELEWKRFELLCAKYYEVMGFKSETLRCGADGGIDVKLYRIDPTKPLAIVQCKAWNSAQVGVAPVRELLGVMTSEKVGRGVFLTTSTFTKEALAFAAANPIQLLDGPEFVRKICDLPEDAQSGLLRFAFAGDYATPTCASCGIKMIRRDSKRGAFWGCRNYPRCKSNFAIRRHALKT